VNPLRVINRSSLLIGHATIADECEVGLGGQGDYSSYRLAMDVRPAWHRRDAGLVPVFSYFLTSREADAAATVRSSAMTPITADIAADTTRRGLVTHATERLTAGFCKRRARMRPAASAGCSAMPGKTVTRSVVATTSQMA
jgi:hypothetical protein